MRPEHAALRARRILGAGQASGAAESTESRRVRTGPPDAEDQKAIGSLILKAAHDRQAAIAPEEASGIAAKLVADARRAMLSLESGAVDGALADSALVALEAVMHTRGRPAVKVLDGEFEAPKDYPGGGIWQALADLHERSIIRACSATAALRVADALVPGLGWVQGTAWLIAPNLAVTNRHVLFPPLNGTALARRIPGTPSARLKRDYTVSLDFVYDSGATVRDCRYRVTDVPFVSADSDPIDAAVLLVEPASGASPVPLVLSQDDSADLDRLYVIGHPGLMETVPEKVRAVFGDPDARKRISFGEQIAPAQPLSGEIVHDASTIGGYSGGCVLGFLSTDVWALHYWGDPVAGNRAFTARALRRHPELGRFFSVGDH